MTDMSAFLLQLPEDSLSNEMPALPLLHADSSQVSHLLTWAGARGLELGEDSAETQGHLPLKCFRVV